MMASTSTMAEEEFNDPQRIDLINALKSVVPVIPSSTTWACLWLSDIDKLRLCVQNAMASPKSFRLSAKAIEAANLIPKCWFTNLIFFL